MAWILSIVDCEQFMHLVMSTKSFQNVVIP